MSINTKFGQVMVIFGTLLNCNCGRMINIFGNRKQNALMINETNERSRENSVLYFTEYHRGAAAFLHPLTTYATVRSYYTLSPYYSQIIRSADIKHLPTDIH